MEEVILWDISYDKKDFDFVFIAITYKYIMPLNTNITLYKF